MTEQEKKEYAKYLQTLTRREVKDLLEEKIAEVNGNNEMAESSSLGLNEYGAKESDYEHEATQAQIRVDIIKKFILEDL